jgi:hypothetical protein
VGETEPTAEAVQAWRTFLESTPANSSVKIAGLAANKWSSGMHQGHWYQELPSARIQIHCSVDGGVRGFDCKTDYLVLRSLRDYFFLQYQCRDCGRSRKTFAVLVDRKSESVDAEVMKLGEFPPFAAPISKRVEKLLQVGDRELYRKGTRSEAQGLGIGAATYFRRIVESQWQLLVTEIRDAAEKLGVTDLSVFDEALKETQFSAAVRLLKDAIPPKLLILGGENPLTLLYQPLSEGLHGLTDHECLQQAADIRTVLTALLENIADVLKDQNELQNAAARLKQRKPTDTR